MDGSLSAFARILSCTISTKLSKSLLGKAGHCMVLLSLVEGKVREGQMRLNVVQIQGGNELGLESGTLSPCGLSI